MSSSKLHPIYVAVDNHQYNRAIKLCLALPKTNVLGQALLAHSYAKSGQRYKSLLALQSILGKEGYQELQLEIRCSLEARQEAIGAAGAEATQQPKAAPTNFRKGGKKGKKKPAATSVASKQATASTVPDAATNKTLIQELDDTSMIDDRWENLPPPEKSVQDETTLGTLAVTLQNLKLPLTVYQVYCCAISAKQNITLEEATLLQKAFLAGLSVIAAPHYDHIAEKVLANMQKFAVQLARVHQQTDIAMNKTATSWAAQTILWQLKLKPRSITKKKDERQQQETQKLALLPRLAENFASKCTQQRDNLERQAEDYFLYLRALECQSKWQEMISVLENDFSEAGLMLAAKQQVLEQKAEVLQKMEQFQEARIIYEQLLKKDYPDNWMYWKGYLGCSIREHAGETEKGILQTEQLINEVISEQDGKEEPSSNYPLRGPHLMKVEVAACRIKKLSDAGGESSPGEELVAKLVQTIMVYGDAFSSRVSCAYSDLCPYLDLLLELERTDQIEVLLAWLQKLRSSAPDLLSATKDCDSREHKSELRKYVFSVQMTLKTLAKYDDLYDTWKTDWKELVRIWRGTRLRGGGGGGGSTADASDGGGGDQTNMSGDELILLAVQQLLHKKDPSSKELFTATTLLETGIKHSPGNANLKVTAIHVYSQQSAVSRCWELFKDLQIKHIQLDSCSFVILPHLLSGGYYRETIEVCQEILRLHTTVVRDTGEFVGRALENGTLSKGEEFLVFQREKMSRSLTALEAKGLILDSAPLSFHDAKNDTQLGAAHGIVGGPSDFERATQMVVETRNPYGALSLLSVIDAMTTRAGVSPRDVVAEETDFSDNRDLSILSHEVLARRDVDTRSRIIYDSMRRGYYHSLLIRAALCVKNTKGPKKGKIVPASDELRRCCTSLLKMTDVVSNYYSKQAPITEGYGEFMEATLGVCRTLAVMSSGIIIQGQNDKNDDTGKIETRLLEPDTMERREEQATNYLKNAQSQIHDVAVKLGLKQDKRDILKTHTTAVSRVCRLLPDCIVPLFALFRMCNDVMETFGLGKRKRKTKPSAEALSQLAAEVSVVIQDMRAWVQSLTKDDSLDGEESHVFGDSCDDLVDEDILKQMTERLAASRKESQDRVDPILNELQSYLDSFTE